MLYVIRMDAGEMLIALAMWLMPDRHPHKAAWQEGKRYAERLLRSSP